jgi:RNA polymerase sigma-19 factor, ECF subfamily
MSTHSKPLVVRFARAAFSKYAAELHRYLARRLGASQDAEDLTQEIFMRLLRFEDTDFVRNPQAYLYGVASHVVREFKMRAEQERDRLEFNSQTAIERAEHPDQPPPDELGESLNLERQLTSALQRLPPGPRAVLLCIKRDGMSYQEAAQATGLSVHTVEKYLFDALARIRTMRWDR